MKLRDSIFGTPEFSKLSKAYKAAFVTCYENKLEELDSAGLEFCATVLLRGQCECKLVDVILDESTGLQYGVSRKNHYAHCPAKRYPTLEDYSFRTILRRQRREVLLDNSQIIMLEEKSAAVRKK